MAKARTKKQKLKKAVFTLATLGLLGVVGTKIAQRIIRGRDDDKDGAKQEQPATQQRDFMTMAMEEYYPEVFIAVEELETNRQTPKKQSGESRYTYWNGLTWVYTVDKNGKIHQHACTGTYKDQAAQMNRDQREEQFRLHLRFETFKRLQSAINGKPNINHNMIIGLCMAGYQLPGHMSDIAIRLNDAKNTQEIMDAFKYKLPSSSSWREGTLKRRWWCGAYAAGLITAEDLLSLPKDSFSKISLSNVATGIKTDKNGRLIIDHFKYDKATVKYALNTARTNGTKEIVENIMNDSQSGRDAINFVRYGQTPSTTASYDHEKWKKEYDAAVAEFQAGNFADAARKFESMLKDYPNDALLLNDLATTYNQLGEYNKALECTTKIFTEIKNSSQYAAAYYNAGVAREKLGQYKSALANYQQAQKHGNKSKAVSDAIARVQSLAAKISGKNKYLAATKMLTTSPQVRPHKMQNMRTRGSRTYNA